MSQVNGLPQKFKIIRTYLKNLTGRERLSGTALLNIEAEKAEVKNVSPLIDNSANLKTSKVKL